MVGRAFKRESHQKSIRRVILMSVLYCSLMNFEATRAQSIGYHPQFNFGFNPYSSPIFGYGLGVPFGAYSMSPAKNPWLVGLNSGSLTDKASFLSKLHAKAFLKKLASSQILSSGYYGMKDKLNLLKYPEYAYTPYSNAYGYGKHYGSALITNNPYKSTYSDYYENDHSLTIKPSATVGDKIKPNVIPIGGRPTESQILLGPQSTDIKPYIMQLKPLIKAGAIITTALLGKKILDNPYRLNPSGMILSETRP